MTDLRNVVNWPESPKTNTFTLSREAMIADSSFQEENNENPAHKTQFFNLIGSIHCRR